MKETKQTVIELRFPREEILKINQIICGLNQENCPNKLKNYKINILVVGFVNLEGQQIFQPERYSVNNLPLDVVEEIIVHVFSLEETTNYAILKSFITENF